MNWIMYLLATVAGAINPIQAGANAQLKKSTNEAIFSAIAVYASGLLGCLLLQAFLHFSWPGGAKLSRTPWWAWTGGALSIGATMAGITFAQKMGSGLFTGISVTASLVSSVLLDHYGWVGFTARPASTFRLIGCSLMIAGLWMVAKF